MKKRVMAIICTIVLAGGLLAGCGQPKETQNPAQADSETTGAKLLRTSWRSR